MQRIDLYFQAAPQSEPAKQNAESGGLQVGQASGTYIEVVELKYAYAGRGERFGQEAMIILVTDKQIPPESVAEEIKSQTLLQSEKLRGLEYVIDKDGLWVRYHPSQHQEARINN